MAKPKRTPKQQMRRWLVGWPSKGQIIIRARTARAAIRKWQRGTLDQTIALHDYWLDVMQARGLTGGEIVAATPGREMARYRREWMQKPVPIKKIT